MTMRRAIRLFVFLGLPGFAAGTWAATCTSLGSGNWNNAATWSCAAVPLAGDDVVIANGHTVTVNTAAVCRDVTINNGNADSTLVIAGANSLTASRDITINANTAGRIKLLDVAGGTLSVGRNLTLASTGNNRIARLAIGAGTATIAGNLTANNQPNREQVVFSAAGVLRIGGNFTNGGTLTAGSGTVTYNGGGAQNIGAYTYNHLTVAKAGGTATFGGNVTLVGNFTHDGGFNGITGNRTATFAGAAAQTIGGTAASSSFYRIDLNNANGLTINHNVTVSNRLRFLNGRVTTGANLLSVGISNASSGTIAGSNANRFVVGNLARWIRTAGGSVAYDFPVGSLTRALANLRFRAVTTGNYVRVATVAGDHPQIATSGINPALSVNRYWTVANLGVVFNVAAPQRRMIFNWVAADRDGGSNPNAYVAKRYSGGAWSDTDLAPGRTATSITLNPYLEFGDFAIGEPLTVVVPGGFNAFETATPPGIAGVIHTKAAGSNIDLAIVALNAAKTAVETLFTGDVKIELLDASNNAGALDANGCRPSWTPLPVFVPPTLTFALADLGRKNVTLTESNAWREVRVRMTYPALGAPLAIGCSTDNFAIRPAALGMAVTDSDWQTAGIARTLNNAAFPGGTVHKAGQPFTITVTGYNALSVVTSNYDGSPTANLAGFVLPPLGACPTCSVSVGAFSGAGGTVTSSTATYSEVGVFQLQMADDSWAAVDAADGSTAAERTAYSVITTVGRFVPDHFELTAGAVTAACTTGAPAFTYMGQPFQSLAATVQAQNASNAVTVNYNSPGYAPGTLATLAWQAENANNGIDLSVRMNVTAPSPLWSNGVYSLSSAAASFRRASPDNPDGPYDSLQLGLRLTDPDAVALNGLDMNAATAGACLPCNAKAVGAATSVRFGRLRLSNAVGSELRPLIVPVSAQYWNGTGFSTNFADYQLAVPCTSLAGLVSLGNFQGNLNAGETLPLLTGVLGATNHLSLSIPGLGNQGSVDVRVNLGGMTWLRGRWDDTSNPDADATTLYDDDPAARATFGIHRDSMIYRREIAP